MKTTQGWEQSVFGLPGWRLDVPLQDHSNLQFAVWFEVIVSISAGWVCPVVNTAF